MVKLFETIKGLAICITPIVRFRFIFADGNEDKNNIREDEFPVNILKLFEKMPEEFNNRFVAIAIIKFI